MKWLIAYGLLVVLAGYGFAREVAATNAHYPTPLEAASKMQPSTKEGL